MFKFKRLIDKYTVSFTVEYALPGKEEPTVNDYDDLGNYIGGPKFDSPVQEKGALIPLSEKVIYNSSGRLTNADRILYSLNHNITEKSRITYKDLVYSVESKIPYEDYADFAQYTLKAVSAFG